VALTAALNGAPFEGSRAVCAAFFLHRDARAISRRNIFRIRMFWGTGQAGVTVRKNLRYESKIGALAMGFLATRKIKN